MTKPPTALDAGVEGFFERHPWMPYVLLTSAMLIYAGIFVTGRALRADIPPMGLMFWRSLTAVLLLTPFVLPLLRSQLTILRHHWRVMFVLGTAQAVTGQGLVYVGLQSTTAINAGVINITQPPLMMVAAWLLLDDRITPRQVAGIVIAALGVAAIIFRGDPERLLELEFVIGDLWVQLAMLSFGLYAALLKKYAPPGLNPFVLFLGMTAAATVLLLPLHAAEIVLWGRGTTFGAATVAGVLYLAIFGAILGLVFVNIAISRIGPGRAGAFFYLIPVFTALLAVLLLGETLQLYHLVGLVMAASGVYVTTRPSSRGSRSTSKNV